MEKVLYFLFNANSSINAKALRLLDAPAYPRTLIYSLVWISPSSGDNTEQLVAHRDSHPMACESRSLRDVRRIGVRLLG
jgi:hypothetical protein